jgi:hypothetical protein
MKRSSQVALLLMGTMSVGAGAYALMPSENCPPAQGGVAQPGSQSAECRPRTSSSGYSYYGGSGSGSRASSSSGYLSQNLASGNSSAASAYTAQRTASNTSTTSRGGFGSFASHFTGGG